MHSANTVSRAQKWGDDAARPALLAIYREVDALLAPYGCELSGDCCDVGISGREPAPTTVEMAEVLHAAKRAPHLKSRRLPLAEAPQRCAMLGDDGRCRIYASRPFGCRTFFCARMTGPRKLPRAAIVALSRRIAELSEQTFSRDPLPRPLSRWLSDAKGADAHEALARNR